MKGSLLNKMPGTNEQKFATLRALYAYMWAHPGKKLLFMGGEFGQWREWTETESLDWHLIEEPLHGGIQKLIRDLNNVYGPEPALWEADSEPAGFEWLDVDNALENIVALARRSPSTGREIICVCNFSAVPKKGYRLRLPEKTKYKVIINTSDTSVALLDGAIDLPPLTTIWLAPQKSTKKTKPQRSTKDRAKAEK
jgi:1,4-alpha-glucan branching enzyme